MDQPTCWQETFEFFAQQPIVVEPVNAHLSTDAGLLPIRHICRESYVHISLRADSGFATPHVYNGCEDLGIRYTMGLRMNPVLQRRSEETLAEAVAGLEESGQP